jgi:hypothetical protein
VTTFDELAARIAKLEDTPINVDDLPMAQLQRWLGQRWLEDAVADLPGTLSGYQAALGVGSYSTPAAGIGAVFSVTCTHALGTTPSGALFAIVPGGGLLSNIAPMAVTNLTAADFTAQFTNQAGFALGASTIAVAHLTWRPA